MSTQSNTHKASPWLPLLLLGMSLWPAQKALANNVDALLAETAFVSIPAGCFEMGVESVPSIRRGTMYSGPRPDEIPRHRVCLDAFQLADKEVTIAQWQRVMQPDTPVDKSQANLPQAHVTWQNAQRFLMRLNQVTPDVQFRLPTEAEWEYACLAGTDESQQPMNTREYVEQLKDFAWFNLPTRSDEASRPVGELQPNAWGLYDMRGNLWEWTADEYQPDGYQSHALTNPLIDTGGERRVIRGGSYSSNQFQVRCGVRNYGLADDPLPTQGLRLVKYQPAP